MTETHPEKKPQELRYVVEVFASVAKTNPGKDEKVKRGPWGIFGTRTCNDTYSHSSIGAGKHSGGALDVSTVPEVLAAVEALTGETEKWVKRWEDNPPKPGFIYDTRLEVELWVGTAEQFEPRPSDNTKLWSKRGALGARLLTRQDISEATLDAFIDNFNTPEKHLKATIEAAVAPVQGLKPMKTLKTKSAAP